MAGWLRLLWRRQGAEELAATEQRRSSSPIGEEAEMSDADQPLGQHMDEEASQEFIGRYGHDLLFAT